MLGAAARALDAQRYGLDVTGQNIANVNTPGYSRRMLTLGEVPPRDAWSAGGGVDVVAVKAARAPLLEARLRQELPAGGREGAIAEQLAVIEAGLGKTGASLDAALGRFYNAFGSLAQSPTSSVARQQVVIEGQALASTFNNLSERFDAARRAADTEVRDVVRRINALANEIAGLNAGIVDPGEPAVESLHDRQAVALAELSELADIQVIRRESGAVDVSIGNGRALVVNSTTYDLTATSAGPEGLAAVFTDGAAVTTEISGEINGGRLAGLLEVRDSLVPGYQDRLDALAFAVSGDVNALTTSGFDLNGAAGTNFFEPLAGAADAASFLQVRAAVVADHALVVAGGAATPGNNDIAKAIAALQDSNITGGNTTPVGAWADLVYRVGTDGQAAALARDRHEEVTKQLETLRDQVSGVSLDEEAAMLMRFQRAYEANARFFQVANQALDVLMGLVRV